jgi:predicted SAM-dependent methyltransferase
MKINVGCGKLYKKGYVNIDFYDNTVADKIHQVTNLEFPDNSADRIEACQVIEHLGFFTSVYALAEWFRMLKPCGTLLIETPDLEYTFKAFLHGDEGKRRDLLVWIYGVDIPGMKHKLCFHWKLLKELIKKSGFVDVKNESVSMEKNRQTLRVSCKKPDNCLKFQFIASFRSQLNRKGIIDLSNEDKASDLENIIGFIFSRISKYKNLREANDGEVLEIVSEVTCYSPKIVILLIKQFETYKIIEKERADVFYETLAKLDRIKLPKVLVQMFENTPITSGTQKQTFKLVHDMGKEGIRKLLHSQNETVLDSLSDLAARGGKTSQTDNIEVFSESALKSSSNTLFSQGIKEFALGNHDKANEKFSEAIILFRDNILNYINMARLMRILDNEVETEENYASAIRLLDIFNYGENAKIRKSLETEKISREKIDEPLVSLNKLLKTQTPFQP